MNGRIHRPNQDAGIQLPRIGHIKTGMKSAKGYPMSVDYFIASGQYQKYFNEVYEKPNVIQIIFFDDRPEISCNEQYILIDKDGKRFGSGNGIDFEIWNGTNYQKLNIKDYPNLMSQTENRAGSVKGWEVIMTLRFILPKIPSIYGHWEYTTRAKASSIPSIRETFDNLLDKRGSITGMIFDLSVSFAKSFKPGSKDRYPVVNLIANHSNENLAIMKESFKINNKQIGQ